VNVDKSELKKPKADIFRSFLVFAMNIFIICFIFFEPLVQSEWNKAVENRDDAIDKSLPKYNGMKSTNTIGIMKVKTLKKDDASSLCNNRMLPSKTFTVILKILTIEISDKMYALEQYMIALIKPVKFKLSSKAQHFS
jgi:hypothetical protein